MTPARVLTALSGVPGLFPRADQREPPTITWDDGPSGRTAAATLTAAGFEVSEPFWGGGLVDVGVEPCVFQRVLRPETAALLWLHGSEPDTPGGDADLARRVFATDLPAGGHRPGTHQDGLAVHLLLGELGPADFGGDELFARIGAAVRRVFGGRPGLVELAGRAVIWTVDGSRSAHAAYIRAVAAALEDAGVPVADWRADDGPVRDGWIPFDLARQVRLHGRPVWDHDQAGAGWSEERGWYLLTVDDPAGRDVRTTEALGIAVIAAPGVVARTVADLAGLRPGDPPRPEADADFPGHRATMADPAFEAALLRYSASRTKSVDGWRDAAEGRG